MLSKLTFIGRTRFYIWDRYYTYTIRIILITICLLATLVYAQLFNDMPIIGLLIVGAFAGISVVLFVYYNFSKAILLIPVISTLMTGGVSTGTGTPLSFTFLFALLLVAIWLFKMLLVEKSLKVRPAPANIPATIFIILVPIALIWSSVYVDPQVRVYFDDKPLPRIMAALVIMLSPLMYFLYANHIRTEGQMQFFVIWFLFVGGVFCFIRLINFNDNLPFLNLKGQFPTWVGVLAISMLLFHTKLKNFVRLYLMAITAGWLYITVGLGLSWLSGWLPLLCGIGILTFLYSRPLFLVLLVAAGILIYTKIPSLQAAYNQEQHVSGSTRGEAAGNVLNLIARKHLLFGTGPAGYIFYFEVYVTGLFQLSHNTYLDIIAQTGLTGFIAYILMWLGMGWMALKTYLIVPKGGFFHALGAFLLAAWCISVVTGMLGDWIIPFAYTGGLGGFDYAVWHWLMPGMTVALYYYCKEQQINLSSEQADFRKTLTSFPAAK